MGDDVRRTYRIVNCKKYRIKSLYGNKLIWKSEQAFMQVTAKAESLRGNGLTKMVFHTGQEVLDQAMHYKELLQTISVQSKQCGLIF